MKESNLLTLARVSGAHGVPDYHPFETVSLSERLRQEFGEMKKEIRRQYKERMYKKQKK